jgi:PadR family transcriptional regulator PadR
MGLTRGSLPRAQPRRWKRGCPANVVSPRGSCGSSKAAPALFPSTVVHGAAHSPKILLLFKIICNCNVVAMADILGSFEQAVLLAIIRLESGAYGRAILKEVQVRLDRDVAAGAVQATLERLERKGLVRSKVGSGTPIRDGRARRFYTVLSEGLRALDEARKMHETIWRGFSRPLKGEN